MRGRVAVVSIILLSASTNVHAQDVGIEFFEKKIRPVLVEHCYECHAATAKKVRGGLLLDTRDGVRNGGFNGPAVVPGDPDKSLLIKAVRYADPDMKMPKKGKLPAALIADLEAWVRMGAPDPREKTTTAKSAKSWDEIVAERRQWWSLQPIKRVAPPTRKNPDWSADPIDRFILAGLEAKGLTPAPDADPNSLLRRLNLVLTGLPPTAAEVAEFTKAWDTAGAKRKMLVANAVDRLLASPHFGERWARHWMDVVRFTETHGNEWNYEVHHAWRYRDYLIRAFNEDVPYDRFVREHIAGDLVKPRWNEKDRINETVIGTAFYRFGEVNHDDCIDLRSIGYDIADNQIDTLSKAFQAMTIACARCHDHKLDAISMRDYHGILGILRSSRAVAHTIDAPEVNADTVAKMLNVKKAIRAELANAWSRPIDADKLDKLLRAPANEKTLDDNPFDWLRLVHAVQEKKMLSLPQAWKEVSDRIAGDDAQRTKFNDANFTTLADFRNSEWGNWSVDGYVSRGHPHRAGDFTVAADDTRAVASLLPAGAYTHSISKKLNGTLRSPILSTDRKYISFQVLGENASAVRLVSNNCQLNYRNFKYLMKDELHWITFPIPPDADGLRVYAELMTKFDNPKFPDQLGALGAGKDYRVPWERAAADPRSHFGITHVVLHNAPAPPKTSLSHLRSVFTGPTPTTPADLSRRVTLRFEKALAAWRDDRATDDDVRWLNAFVQVGLLKNSPDLTPQLKKLIAEYRKLDGDLSIPRVAPGLADFGPGFDQPIFARGDCMKPGVKTPRRFVEVLAASPFSPPGSGRLGLADAIASPDNPLTARVMVNRVWHHLFGTGIVRTVDDFGHVGELPSHPELLDYLAARFVADGWSIKKLIRTIVLTRTFQLAHTPTAAMMEVDPENRLVARYPARRMEAEAIRDSLLAASGRLDRTLFGPSIPAYRDKEYADRRLFQGPLDGNGRRSIYIKVTLMEPPKFLEVFNFPGSKVCQGRRDVTNVPAQGLAMLNDPFVHAQADVWSKRLIERKGDTLATRLDALFAVALSRPPRPEERERFERFATQVAAQHGVARADILGSAAVWRDVGHAMFNLREFISIP